MIGVNPEVPPPLWITDENSQFPRNSTACQVAVEFLHKHIAEPTEWNKQCIRLLNETDVSAYAATSKIMRHLYQEHPHLFDCITVKMGEQSQQIPKSHLVRLSPKFKAQIQSDYSESKKGVIDLGPEDPDSAQVFLSFLATGEVNLSGENVLPLFTLADQHLIPRLTHICTGYLIKHLDADSFPDILKQAVQNKNAALLWICFGTILNNPTSADQIPRNSPEATLINVMRHCLSKGISTAWFFVNKVHIQDADTLDLESIAFLKRLHRAGGIKGLRVGKATSLTSLNFIETLDSLEIGHPSFSVSAPVPESWLRSARYISCTRTSLTNLNTPMATSVSCDECPSLTNLNAPMATSVSCYRCPSLTTIDAPNALSFTYTPSSNFLAITRLRVKKGCRISGMPITTVFEKFPDLVEVINVKIGTTTRVIFRDSLDLHAPTLANLAKSNERSEKVLDLDPVDSPVALTFLSFLATGELALSHNNVLAIYTLANRYALQALMEKCHEYLKTNLDPLFFPIILRHAVDNKFHDILWICLHIISYYPDFRVPLDFPEASLLKTARTFKSKGIILISSYHAVSILDASALDFDDLTLLKTLHQAGGIRRLEIKQATSLESLDFIQTLDTVTLGIMRSREIGSYFLAQPIPEGWLKNARVIYVYSCTGPFSINAPLAEYITCDTCPGLSSIDAPKAKRICCSGSPKLMSTRMARGCKIEGSLPEGCKVEYV